MKIDNNVLHCFSEIVLDDVRGVLLDLDGTLYSYQPCHERGVQAAFEECSFGLDFDEYSASYRHARNDVTVRLSGQGACRSRLLAFQMMAEQQLWPAPYAVARKLDKCYWSAFIHEMSLDAEALHFLQRCRERNIVVCLVTDMTAHVQIDKLKRLRVESFIDQLVTSEEVGAEKPSPRMFEAGLRKLGLNADQVIMIGDDFRKDILGGVASGIRSFQIDLGRAS